MSDTVTEFVLVIPGAPHGKSRPRFGAGGKAYMPDKHRSFSERVTAVWLAAGSPRLDDGEPVAMELTISRKRPASHFKADGLMSAAGRRAPFAPTTTPDLDNAAGSIMDALNGLAYADDRLITKLSVRRRWDNVDSVHCVAGLDRPWTR